MEQTGKVQKKEISFDAKIEFKSNTYNEIL